MAISEVCSTVLRFLGPVNPALMFSANPPSVLQSTQANSGKSMQRETPGSEYSVPYPDRNPDGNFRFLGMSMITESGTTSLE